MLNPTKYKKESSNEENKIEKTIQKDEKINNINSLSENFIEDFFNADFLDNDILSVKKEKNSESINIEEQKKEKIDENCKEEVTQEDKETVYNSNVIKNKNEITADDLIMNAFQVEYPIDEDNTEIMTVIAAPLKRPDECSSLNVPIIAMAKYNGHILTQTSITSNRSSILMNVDTESIIIKGTWVDNHFKAFVYPQKTFGRSIKVVRTEYGQYNPNKKFIGHYLSINDNGDEFHILPMSTSNSKNGYVQFIAFLKNEKEMKNIIKLSATGKELILDKYKINVYWDNVLNVDIQS